MTSVDRYTPYEKPLPIQLNSMTDSVRPFRVMTSGVFTAAHLALVPTLEALLGMKVLTVTTSIGTGENSIPNRLKRTEPVDLVIVAATNMRHFVDAGYILADSAMLIAKSSVAIAVREGAPPAGRELCGGTETDVSRGECHCLLRQRERPLPDHAALSKVGNR
jgi:hypothetical protein